jgi:TetR/AcrR family transcriptional repressor of nem operon
MARPREFDESHALDAAMQCFWRRGYEATSLRDLMRAMGLTAPSLYNSFGDKQKLFVRTLERYLDHTTRDRLRRLEQTCRRVGRSNVSLPKSSSIRSRTRSVRGVSWSIRRWRLHRTTCDVAQ